MTNQELFRRLTDKDLVDAAVLKQLQKLAARSPDQFNAQGILGWLVSNGHLTKVQADRLAQASAAPAEEEELLELAPVEEAAPPPQPKQKPAPAAKKSRPTWRDEKPPQPAPPNAQQRAAAAGPLDDLLGDPLSSGSYQAPAANQAPGHDPFGAQPAEEAPKKAKKAQKETWGGPWFLGGIAVLLLAVLAVPALVWSINRQTGDKAFELAEADYSSGSYSQAINKYQEYLKDFPDHTHSSKARVRLGMCQLRQTVDGASDWQKALATTTEILTTVAPETDFNIAHEELAALLPKVAEGLTDQARGRLDPQLVPLAHAALDLVEKYVPKSMRPEVRMKEARQSLALTEHLLQRNDALRKAISEIEAAIASQQLIEVYRVRGALLRAYPDLADDADLTAAVMKVTEAERQAVVVTEESRPAETTDAPSAVRLTVVSAPRPAVGTEATASAVLAFAGGACYGLRADTGEVLWRRFVGLESPNSHLVVDRAGGQDFIVYDSVRQELLGLDGATGKLAWRQPLGDIIDAPPVLLKDRILVAARSGKLYMLDAATGTLLRTTQLPAGLPCGPAADPSFKRYYQLAAHSNLFVLDVQTGACLEVFYVGHEAGSIRVPPYTVSRYVFLAENYRQKNSRLRVLLSNDEGLQLQPTQDLPLTGHVYAPPYLEVQKLFVSTDQGALVVFEVLHPDQQQEIKEAASKPAEDAAVAVRYPYGLVRDARLWVAGGELTMFNIQIVKGRLEPQWVRYQGDQFLQAPQVVNDLLFTVRHPRDSSWVAAAACDRTTGDPLWETILGAPPLPGPPLTTADQATLSLLDVAGSATDFPSASLNGQGVLIPLSQQSVSTRLLDVQRFASSFGSAHLNSAQAAFIVESATQPSTLVVAGSPGLPRLQQFALPDRCGGELGVWKNSVVVPFALGQVALFDPATGQQPVAPFQPPLDAGQQIVWGGWAVTPSGKLALVNQTQSVIYLLDVVPTPAPHLEAVDQFGTPAPLVTKLCLLGDRLVAADASGRLLALEAETLTPVGEYALGSPIAWGPFAVGDHLIAYTQSQQLFCLDDTLVPQWQAPLEDSPVGWPAGQPEQIWIATIGGQLTGFDAASGAIAANLTVGQPLASGPLQIGGVWQVLGQDGCLLCVE